MLRERGYRTVSIPAELAEEIDRKVVGRYGYRSRSGVVSDAIRRFLEVLESRGEVAAR